MPVMINNKTQVRVQSFNRGQNSNDNPLTLKPGSAQLLENCFINKIGDAEQRTGTTRIGDNPDALISKWTFDAGDATDDKSDNDGSVYSVTFPAGKFGKCAEFNGTSSYISVPADSTLDITTIAGAFRVSAWIFVDTDGEGDEGRIVDKDGTLGDGYYLAVNNESSSTVKIKFYVQYGTTDAHVQTSTTLTTGAWHKIDAVHNSDKSLDVYIDGALASYSTDVTGVGTIANDSSNALIIGNNAAGTRTFDGKIDDVRFYTGATTAAKVALDKVQGITRFTVGTSLNKVYRLINTSLQKLDADFKGWTDIDTGFTADKVTNFVQAKDILFILNGTDNVHSMDSGESITDEGNTNADPPLTTVGEYMSNNRLFLGGSLTAATRDHIWFSDSLAPQTFDRTVNVIKVRSGGGGAVTALKQFKHDELIVYKEDSVFILFCRGATPLTDWKLDVVHPDVGTKSGRTVANLRNEQIFLDSNADVRLLTRTEFDKYRAGIISDKIKNVLRDINMDQLSKCVGYFYDEKYFLFFPTGSNTEPNKGVVWDSVASKLAGDSTEGWSVIPDGCWYPSCFTEYEFSDNAKALLYGDNRDISLVHRAFSGNTDDGKAITMKVRGQLHTLDNAREMVWGPLLITASSDDDTLLTVRASTNNATYRDVASMTVNSTSGGVNLPVDLPFDFGSGAGYTSKYLHTKKLGRARSFSVEIEHNQYNKSVSVKEYSLWASQKG